MGLTAFWIRIDMHEHHHQVSAVTVVLSDCAIHLVSELYLERRRLGIDDKILLNKIVKRLRLTFVTNAIGGTQLERITAIIHKLIVYHIIPVSHRWIRCIHRRTP